jgi:hypothetical protein
MAIISKSTYIIWQITSLRRVKWAQSILYVLILNRIGCYKRVSFRSCDFKKCRHSRESGNLAHYGKDSCLRRNDGNERFEKVLNQSIEYQIFRLINVRLQLLIVITNFIKPKRLSEWV